MENSWLNLMNFNINRNRMSLGEQKKKGFYELAEYDDFINYQNPIELF